MCIYVFVVVVYLCECVHVCLSACVCMCVCEAAVTLRLEGWLTDREVASLMPSAAVVSLSKELYSHCSSPPSCINGDLAIAGEANVKLCVSHLIVEVQVRSQVPIPSSIRHVKPSCEALVLFPGGFVLH